MKKKVIGIIIAIIVIIALVLAGVWYFRGGSLGIGKSSDKVYVQQVSEVTGWNDGAVSSYSGIVESQEVLKVNKDAERTVKEILVKVGDSVQVDTPLFTYDTTELESQIASLQLEMEEITNDINNYNAQINELVAEKATVSPDAQFEYTTQIQSIQMDIKQSQYDLKAKQSEVDKLKENAANSTVTSKIAGVVKSIAENADDMSDNTFISILATGDYRVKGTVDEQNVSFLQVGQEIIIRSRVDETLTWKGKVATIDTESPASSSNDNDYYGGESDSSDSATKYPFYVTLESTDGLLLGQHVFIQPDLGLQEAKAGIWLGSEYVCTDEDGSSFVWAANSNNKLVKQKVELGELDELSGRYEILSGLTEDDYITFPMEGLYEGITTVTSYDEIDYSSPLYNQEGSFDTEFEEFGTEFMDGTLYEEIGTEAMGVEQ